jgi:hypothetical protein
MKIKTTKTSLQAALLAGSLFIGSSIASQAVVYTWTSASDTDWTNGANWAGGTAPTSLTDTTTTFLTTSTVDSIVFSGSVLPTTNIPTFNDASLNYDNLPMIFNSGGTFTLDFSTSFNDSMWIQSSRTQYTVGNGTDAVTLNVNNMSVYNRNDVDAAWLVNSGSALNINGNLTEYADASLAKNGIFNLNGGAMVVSGIASGTQWADNTLFNFSGIGSSLTMDFGGSIYTSLTDVTGDFGTVFNGAIKAIDNGNGTFTVAVPEPSSTALLGLGLSSLLLRRKRS